MSSTLLLHSSKLSRLICGLESLRRGIIIPEADKLVTRCIFEYDKLIIAAITENAMTVI